MSDEPIRRDDREGVTRLTLNRPANRNALSSELLTALDAHLRAIAADRDVRVVVLVGEGPAFSAGHDLRELQAATDPAARERIFAACSAVMLQLGALPQPVVAEVGGVATAAGCQLVASCDLAIAGASARFATPGVDIGLFCSTPAVAVTRTVAPKHAMELLLTGALVDAEHAWRIGLVNRVVADEDLRGAVDELAALLATKPPAVIAAGKAALRAQAALPVDAAYEVASRAMVDGLAAPDAAEGIDAFLTKRTPVWSRPGDAPAG